MTPENFCYWLQGQFELHGTSTGLSKRQAKTIANHLNLVFEHCLDKKVDKGDPATKKKLQDLHDGVEHDSNTIPGFNPNIGGSGFPGLIRC